MEELQAVSTDGKELTKDEQQLVNAIGEGLRKEGDLWKIGPNQHEVLFTRQQQIVEAAKRARFTMSFELGDDVLVMQGRHQGLVGKQGKVVGVINRREYRVEVEGKTQTLYRQELSRIQKDIRS